MRLPVTLTLHPSRTLAGALAFAHGLAALAVALSGLAPGMMLAAVSVLALSLAVAARRNFFRQPATALILRADGTLEVGCGEECAAPAQVRRQTTVFPWLVVLLLKTERGRLALALPPDALGKEGHRQLRMWLRWKASATAA